MYANLFSQSPFLRYFGTHPFILTLIIIWTLIWKGLALWKAVKNNSKIWFILFLILNDLGILEIIYLIYYWTKKQQTQQ